MTVKKLDTLGNTSQSLKTAPALEDVERNFILKILCVIIRGITILNLRKYS